MYSVRTEHCSQYLGFPFFHVFRKRPPNATLSTVDALYWRFWSGWFLFSVADCRAFPAYGALRTVRFNSRCGRDLFNFCSTLLDQKTPKFEGPLKRGASGEEKATTPYVLRSQEKLKHCVLFFFFHFRRLGGLITTYSPVR